MSNCPEAHNPAALAGGAPQPLLDERRIVEVWQAQWLAPTLHLTDGRPLRVIYRGVWTRATGPDFADALLDISGQLVRGAVEVHVRASAWYAHGHDRDPNYCGVALHAVYWDDLGTSVRDCAGRPVPTIALADQLAGPLDTFVSPEWPRLDALGFTHCAPAVAVHAPEALVAVWEAAGDERLASKVARISGQLTVDSPAQTLYALLLDGLGYSANRMPMQVLAERLPLAWIESIVARHSRAERWATAAAYLLGVGGFLPLAPHDAALTGLAPATLQAVEYIWETEAADLRRHALSPTAWHLHRQRPANHPIRRLLAMASLLAHSEQGLLNECLHAVQARHARVALHRWLDSARPYLGADRAHELIVNAVVPFALAYADQTDNDHLREVASQLWLQLPAGAGNRRIQQVREQICGTARVPIRSARAEQGLLHLATTGCRQLRCFECPVARLAQRWSALEDQCKT
jgi:hypothetical protein